ncbi:hypothetical protein F53441_2708 [Fusarium austroafricanum]|uniref:Uncharacterized protein n=1 Tax=Fusarium austroafricanum TaxID=2364996 RepID=A0A8H4KSD1_9HYPO|nr:hypothetical protein F53441_2708 [Fusarium austroafricanum]
MREGTKPLCAICAIEIDTTDYLGVQPLNWEQGLWRGNAVALEGPECLGEPIEGSSHSDELLTWHAATGHASDYDSSCGLTLFPIEKTVLPFTTWGNRDLPFAKSGYLYIGFHSACASIARQFIRLSRASRVKSFCDIWITLNARYSKARNSSWDLAPSIPHKTERGTYIWENRIAYYIPNSEMSHRTDWWDRDPFHIPNLTSRLLENLSSCHMDCRRERSQFQNMLGNLPKELVDEVIGHILSGSMTEHSTDLMPQRFWKQIFIQIPFLWDLDVEQVEKFPDFPADRQREWDWEDLVRTLVCGPRRKQWLECEVCQSSSFYLWDYNHVGLDVPPGLTNRRRIWQVLQDMDPKELDILDEPDFIVLNEDLDGFMALTVKDGVNVEDPYGSISWDEPTHTESAW